MISRFAGSLAAVALAVGLLAACGGSDNPAVSDDPAEAIATARENLDQASSVHVSLATTSQPDSGSALLAADGTLNRQPAFEGNVRVLYLGATVDVPVVSVEGDVYAKLPFSSRYAPIDPQDFGVADPAAYFDPQTGLSGLLAELTDLKAGDATRSGDSVLATITGTLPGSALGEILPTVNEDSDFETVASIDEDGRLVGIEVTGDFFDEGSTVTYELLFTSYNADVTISRP